MHANAIKTGGRMGGWVDLQKVQKGLCTCFRAHGLNLLGSVSWETHKKSVLTYCVCTPTRSRPDASRKISCSPKCARYEAAHQRSNWLRWASCMSRRGSSFCALQVVSTLGVMHVETREQRVARPARCARTGDPRHRDGWPCIHVKTHTWGARFALCRL